MKESQQPWIEQGYATFAKKGPGGLKIERLAKAVGKSKSSFYHHFSELELFIAVLLDYHLAQAYRMAEKEAAATTLTELIDVIVTHKVDMLFNRQLRVHRSTPHFEACLIRTNQITAEAIIPLWAELLELPEHTQLAGLVLKLSLENFYLQITEATLNPEWLANYFHELRTLSRAFQQTGKPPVLYGSV